MVENPLKRASEWQPGSLFAIRAAAVRRICRSHHCPPWYPWNHPQKVRLALTDLMAETASMEAHQSTPEEIDTLCRNFLDSFIHSLILGNSAQFDGMLQRLVDWIEIHEEDTYAWHMTLSALRRGLPKPTFGRTGY